MKLYFKKDVIWELDSAILAAEEMNQKIELIELDPVESEAFLEEVGPLMKRGIVVNEFGTYLYRHIELKLNLK